MPSTAHHATSGSKRLARALLAWCLCGISAFRPVNGQRTRTFQPSSWSRLKSHECPESCEEIFLKLEDGPNVGGGKVQHVEVQERGEPKSGTGFMFEWAMGALGHTCMYLQSAYGGESCRIEWSFMNRTLVFDPRLAAGDPGPCSCNDVDRVTITIVNYSKHTLPVEADCHWSHGGGIAKLNSKSCTRGAGAQRPSNKAELWKCVQHSACRLTDKRLQMAVMRDPRAVAVSTYFHLLRVHPASVKGMSADEFVLALLPIVCQWVSIRYLLFSELLVNTSRMFWYDEAKKDPMEWHQQLLSFVGLRVPDGVVLKAAYAAEKGGHILGFPSKGVDEHKGGSEATGDRLFTNEVTAATLKKMDSVLRLWLPAAVLKQLGVAA